MLVVAMPLFILYEFSIWVAVMVQRKKRKENNELTVQ